ncbi:MAG: CPBP family intramembrane metalloprotease [Mangrovimonas sp.]|nr:CPBP family intramembrane metalloprotease [Mangrovimonas sp.]
MYIEQAFKVLHDWWRYILGVLLAFVGIGIFSMPHAMAIAMKQMAGEIDAEKMQDVNYLMGLFEPNLNLVFLLLPFAGGLLALILAARLIHKQKLTSLTTTRPKIDWSRFWFAFLLWGFVSVGMILLDYWLSPENYQLNFQLQPFLILCVIAILLIPLQTSFEEYMFRGYLMQGIGVIAKNRWFPLLVTSSIFGLLHIANPEVEVMGKTIMIYYIGTGLFLGIMTLMDEGMELALGFHLANNLFTALLVTADWTAFQTYSVFKDLSDPKEAGFVEIIMPVFVIFPILLFIFSKKYKWTNWKDKLLGRVQKPLETNLDEIGQITE